VAPLFSAQPVVPPETVAQIVPPQQAAFAASHELPGSVQVGADVVRSTGEQIRLPGLPTQAPMQQSSVAVHGAPIGAQTL
jgi:hypothetical protein